MVVGDIDFWTPLDEDDRKQIAENIKEHDKEEPLEKHSVEELYVDGQNCLSITSSRSHLYPDGGLFATVSIPLTATHRATAKDFVKAVGLDRQYRADDRGRITIGSQYAGQDVKVVVLSEPEDNDVEGGEDGE